MRDNKISATDFVLYAYLKFQHSFDKAEILQLNRNRTMSDVDIKDRRTLDKTFMNLFYYGLFTKEPVFSGGKIKIEFNLSKLQIKSMFTQLPTDLLMYYIQKTGHVGFRLLYYYESFISRTNGKENMFCYPGYKDIVSTLGISEPTLAKYNQILVDNKLLAIRKHKVGEETTIKDGVLIKFNRYNNHYTPLRGEMRKGER